MNPKKRKIIAWIGILVVSFIAGYLLFPKEKNQKDYIFDKSFQLSLEDVKKAQAPLPLEQPPRQEPSSEVVFSAGTADSQENPSEIDLGKIFSEGLINSFTTLKYFKHLAHSFRKSADLNDHLQQVRKYLFSQFSEKEADELYHTYEKYLRCEIRLASAFKDLNGVKSPEEALEVLMRIQEFRRDQLGDELADRLFGAYVKAQEYGLRRAAIVTDETLYGREKEDLITKLNEEMWGKEAKAVEEFQLDTPEAWKRFKEKQKIYQKDISELDTKAARAEKIKEFQAQFFSADAMKRLEEADQTIAQEKQKETLYREKEKKILDDKTLSEDEKSKQLVQLQDETFGEQADSFRRKEKIRQGRESLIQSHGNKRPDPVVPK